MCNKGLLLEEDFKEKIVWYNITKRKHMKKLICKLFGHKKLYNMYIVDCGLIDETIWLCERCPFTFKRSMMCKIRYPHGKCKTCDYK